MDSLGYYFSTLCVLIIVCWTCIIDAIGRLFHYKLINSQRINKTVNSVYQVQYRTPRKKKTEYTNQGPCRSCQINFASLFA